MKDQFIKNHFTTSTRKEKAIRVLKLKVKTNAEFINELKKLSYSKLKSLL